MNACKFNIRMVVARATGRSSAVREGIQVAGWWPPLVWLTVRPVIPGDG